MVHPWIMSMSLYHVQHVPSGSLLGPQTTYLCVIAPDAGRALSLAVEAMKTEAGDWKVTRNPHGARGPMTEEKVVAVVASQLPLAA